MSTVPYVPDATDLRDCYALVMYERVGQDHDEAKTDAERAIAKIKAGAIRNFAIELRDYHGKHKASELAFHRADRTQEEA